MQQFTGPFSIWPLRWDYFPLQVHKCHCSSPGYHQCGMLFKVSPPLALLQWWSTSKCAGQVLCSNTVLQAGLLLSSLGTLSFTNRCSTPDSFCITVTEYWANTAGTTIFSSPFVAVYSFILPQLSTGVGGGCSLYATRSSYAFGYSYWLTWANKTCWSGLNVIPDHISATFPVFLNIFHPTFCW